MVSFSVMAVAGRELAPGLNTFQIMFFRSLIGLVIVLAVGGIAGTLTQIKTDRLGLHLLRNAAHFSGQNLWFLAVAYIPFFPIIRTGIFHTDLGCDVGADLSWRDVDTPSVVDRCPRVYWGVDCRPARPVPA